MSTIRPAGPGCVISKPRMLLISRPRPSGTQCAFVVVPEDDRAGPICWRRQPGPLCDERNCADGKIHLPRPKPDPDFLMAGGPT